MRIGSRDKWPRLALATLAAASMVLGLFLALAGIPGPRGYAPAPQAFMAAGGSLVILAGVATRWPSLSWAGTLFIVLFSFMHILSLGGYFVPLAVLMAATTYFTYPPSKAQAPLSLTPRKRRLGLGVALLALLAAITLIAYGAPGSTGEARAAPEAMIPVIASAVLLLGYGRHHVLESRVGALLLLLFSLAYLVDLGKFFLPLAVVHVWLLLRPGGRGGLLKSPGVRDSPQLPSNADSLEP